MSIWANGVMPRFFEINWRVDWLIVLFVALFSCDKGLGPSSTTTQQQPPPPMGYMTGLVRFQHWPPADSLFDLRIVSFRSFPPGNILLEVQLGRAIVYPSLGDPSHLPFYVDSLRYTYSLPTGEFQYVVVAQRFGPGITTDWRAVGQYDIDSSVAGPSAVAIAANDTVFGVDISVDFDNPPSPSRSEQ